jgi:hypothetical protein
MTSTGQQSPGGSTPPDQPDGPPADPPARPAPTAPPPRSPAPADPPPGPAQAAPVGPPGGPPVGPPVGTAPAGPAGWRQSRLWGRPGVIAAAILLLLLVILAVVEVVDDSPSSPAGPDNHVAAGPVNGRAAAQFELLSGAASVTVRATDDIGSDLYRVSTPLDSGLLPRAVDHDGRIELQLVPSGPAGPSVVDIRLNVGVRWALRLAGGATQDVLDLSAARTSGVDIVAGVTRIDLTLPRPQGTVPIRLAGGANEFTLHTPVGVPTRVTAGSGAGTITLNGVDRHGLAAGSVLATGGWETATDRYDVQLSSGVAVLTVGSR